jgi:hypothetical protein
MKIEGQIIKHGIAETGVSGQSGNTWTKQTVEIMQGGTYPKMAAVTFFGDEKISKMLSFPIGSMVSIDVNIDSREYNGRYYTNLDAWKIEAMSGAAQAGQRVTVAAPVTPQYKIGDVVNGHQLTPGGWVPYVPVTQPPQSVNPPQPTYQTPPPSAANGAAGYQPSQPAAAQPVYQTPPQQTLAGSFPDGSAPWQGGSSEEIPF